MIDPVDIVNLDLMIKNNSDIGTLAAKIDSEDNFKE